MSTDVNLNRGLQNIINNQPISNGSIWFAEDSQNLYIDSQDGQRIQITDVIDITNIANKALLKYYSNKIYIDGTTLKKYNSITGKLEIISELETEVLESENSFMYDFGEHFKATIIDHSRPKNGSIVIDKNGDIGIVTSSTDRNLNVVVIVKNKSKNVLENYDIYFDSNYIGNSVGTFDCPFSYLYDLVEKCEDLLSNDSFVSIHIKTNSNVGVSVDFIDIDILKNVTFIGSMGSKLDLQYFSNIKLDNVIFKDLILINNDRYDFIFNVAGGSNILIDNCIDKCDNDVMLHAENNSNVNINNSIIKSIEISYTLNSNMNHILL